MDVANPVCGWTCVYGGYTQQIADLRRHFDCFRIGFDENQQLITFCVLQQHWALQLRFECFVCNKTNQNILSLPSILPLEL